MKMLAISERICIPIYFILSYIFILPYLLLIHFAKFDSQLHNQPALISLAWICRLCIYLP